MEKRIATHSSLLAWRISWAEDPGRLQSMDRKESGMAAWLALPRCLIVRFPSVSVGPLVDLL